MKRALSIIAILGAFCFPAVASGAEGDSSLPFIEIGKIKIFRSQNRIEVQGTIAVQRNLIELFACASGGKSHESVVVLDCRPSNLNIAMKLLDFKDGGQGKAARTVTVEDENGQDVRKEVEVLEENGPNFRGDPRKPEGDRVIVSVSWKENGVLKKVRAEDMIWQRERNKAMPRSGWIYTASCWLKNPETGQELFQADYSKTIMTTWHDPEAILDNPLPDGFDDEVYFANPDVVPLPGTAVTLEIRRPTEEEAAECAAIEKREEDAFGRKPAREGESDGAGK